MIDDAAADFGMFEKSKGKSIAELLDTIARLRGDSLRELQMMNLIPASLQKRSPRPELGTETLKQLLANLVVQDLGHVR